MLTITNIRRHGLKFYNLYDETRSAKLGWWYSWVSRINFVREGKHYSVQLSDSEGSDLESSIEVRCKEDKFFHKRLGFGTKEFMKLFDGWDWKKLGETYKTFPTQALEDRIFKEELENDNKEN